MFNTSESNRVIFKIYMFMSFDVDDIKERC